MPLGESINIRSAMEDTYPKRGHHCIRASSALSAIALVASIAAVGLCVYSEMRVSDLEVKLEEQQMWLDEFRKIYLPEVSVAKTLYLNHCILLQCMCYST